MRFDNETHVTANKESIARILHFTCALCILSSLASKASRSLCLGKPLSPIFADRFSLVKDFSSLYLFSSRHLVPFLPLRAFVSFSHPPAVVGETTATQNGLDCVDAGGIQNNVPDNLTKIRHQRRKKRDPITQTETDAHTRAFIFDLAASHNSAPGIPVFRGGDIPVMNPGASSSFDSDVVIQHFM